MSNNRHPGTGRYTAEGAQFAPHTASMGQRQARNQHLLPEASGGGPERTPEDAPDDGTVGDFGEKDYPLGDTPHSVEQAFHG